MSWYFSLDLPRHVDGGRRRLRRGGYLTRDAAAAARERVCILQPGGRVLTVADWLQTWVEMRARLRDSTRRMYRSHVRLHFRGQFDGVLLTELAVRHVQLAFRRLFGSGMTEQTARRLFSTLRSALNAAVREGLILIIRPGTSNCRGPDGRTPWSGPGSVPGNGNGQVTAPQSRCGLERRPPSSSTASRASRCSPSST